MTDSVARYVVTYINKNGARTLATACQGRMTYETREEAQSLLDAMTQNNPASQLDTIYGPQRDLQVRPCPCWPGHFDPKTVWFD